MKTHVLLSYWTNVPISSLIPKTCVLRSVTPSYTGFAKKLYSTAGMLSWLNKLSFSYPPAMDKLKTMANSSE